MINREWFECVCGNCGAQMAYARIETHTAPCYINDKGTVRFDDGAWRADHSKDTYGFICPTGCLVGSIQPNGVYASEYILDDLREVGRV